MRSVSSFAHLSDADLAKEVARLFRVERGATADLVASLAEFDRRRLSLPAGFSSLYVYCRDCLHLGDGAAYRRIEAAKACRRFPIILDMLAEGRVSLTAVTLLSPHLTEGNHLAVLEEAAHLTTREVERIVARLRPTPDVPTVVRRLQDLMRHSVPSGAAAVIIDRALTCLLQEVLRRKTGARKSDFKKEDDPQRPEVGGHAALFH